MASYPMHCTRHQTFSLFYYLFCTHASYPSCIHPSNLHLCSTHLFTHPSCISESYKHKSTHVSSYPAPTSPFTLHPCILQAASHLANQAFSHPSLLHPQIIYMNTCIISCIIYLASTHISILRPCILQAALPPLIHPIYT